ncbi:uncharacterized protein [Prorops nasuta]|uniref:uncharacterized protein n=1 Tax=Prorops nasuta TaxID=863751 RepID=UPI0034CE40F5
MVNNNESVSLALRTRPSFLDWSTPTLSHPQDHSHPKPISARLGVAVAPRQPSSAARIYLHQPPSFHLLLSLTISCLGSVVRALAKATCFRTRFATHSPTSETRSYHQKEREIDRRYRNLTTKYSQSLEMIPALSRLA